MSTKYHFSSKQFTRSLFIGAVVGPVVGLIDACLQSFYGNGRSPSGTEMFFGLVWGFGVKGILMMPFGYLLLIKWHAAMMAMDWLIEFNCTVLGAIIGLIRSVSRSAEKGE